MNLAARFALLFLALTILPSRLFPQAATTKKPTESTTPAQTTDESTA